MTPELWKKVKATLAVARSLPADRREVELDRLRQEDPELAAEVVSLLQPQAPSPEPDQQPASPTVQEEVGAEKTRVRPEGNLDHVMARVWAAVPLGNSSADPEAVPPDVPGCRLDRGEENIRYGGMGVVYFGTERELRRPVAVKVLRRRLAADPVMVARFRDESLIAAQLQHPGIVPVYAIGHLADGRPYCTMKLVRGETFSDVLKRRPTPLADLIPNLASFRRVCEALGYAHGKRIIHRDLKPSNVMVGAHGEVLLVDWGLAKKLGDRTPAEPTPEPHSRAVVVDTRTSGLETQSGLGSLPYLAPEQAAGRMDEVDERSDVFGLGAILCVILTGQPPYIGPTEGAIERKALRARASKVSFLAIQQELMGRHVATIGVFFANNGLFWPSRSFTIPFDIDELGHRSQCLGQFGRGHLTKHHPAGRRQGDHHASMHLLDVQRYRIARQTVRDLFSVLSPDHRFEQRDSIGRNQPQAKAKQCGPRVTQRLGLGVERLRHFQKFPLDRPAVAVEFPDFNPIGDLLGQIGQDVDLGVTITGRRVQFDCHPTKRQRPPIVLQSYALFIHHPGLAPANFLLFSDQRSGHAPMLADDEPRFGPVEPKEKLQGAKVPVRDPQIPTPHSSQDIVEQGSLLGVTVGGQKDIGRQASLLIQNNQRSTRQGSVPGVTQWQQASFGGREGIAVENPDAVARKPRRLSCLQSINDRLKPLGRVLDQSGRYPQLQAVEFVVNGLIRDGDVADALEIGSPDRRLLLENHRGHQLDQLRKQQFSGVLGLGSTFKQLIQPHGGEQTLQNGPGHDAERAFFQKRLERWRDHPDFLTEDFPECYLVIR